MFIVSCRPPVVQKPRGVDNKKNERISFVAGTRASLSVANIKNALQARFKVQLKRVLRLPMRDGNDEYGYERSDQVKKFLDYL